MKTLLQAIAIGTAVTLALFGLGYFAAEQQAHGLSYALYWQAYLLNMAMPCDWVYRGEFLCESMAVAKAVFFAGIPVGIVVYSAATYLVLRLLRRPRAPSA